MFLLFILWALVDVILGVIWLATCKKEPTVLYVQQYPPQYPPA